MISFVFRRLLRGMVVLFLCSVIIFVLVQAVADRGPGTAARKVAAWAAYLNEVEESPVVEYFRWIGGAFQGDLGQSDLLERSVSDMVGVSAKFTLIITFAALLVSLVFGLGLGTVAATKSGRWVRVLAYVGLSLPWFWLGQVMQLVLGIKFQEWGLPSLPVSGMSRPGFSDFAHYVMPVASLALFATGGMILLVRSTIRSALDRDFTVAVASGELPGARVVWGCALRTGLPSALGSIGVFTGLLLGAEFLVEWLFGVPGVGRRIYLAYMVGDYPVLQGAVLMLTFIVVATSVIADILRAWLDPSLRHSKRFPHSLWERRKTDPTLSAGLPTVFGSFWAEQPGWKKMVRTLWKRKTFVVGLAIVVVAVLATILVPIFTDYEPHTRLGDSGEAWQDPSGAH